MLAESINLSNSPTSPQGGYDFARAFRQLSTTVLTKEVVSSENLLFKGIVSALFDRHSGALL